MNFAKSRLREPSTWAGLAALMQSGAAFAATKDPQQLTGFVAGLFAVFMRERGAP